MGFFIALLFLGQSTQIVFAQSAISTSENSRIILLQEIQRLLVEVIRLQALLQEQEKSVVANQLPYELSFFDVSFEEIYFVQNLQLVNADSVGVREVDQQLFDLFVSVIGREVVSNKFKEWRVWHDESDLGAFVESVAGTDTWVVGVNRSGYKSGDVRTQKSFANLFIHEFAHVEFFPQPEFIASYTNRFWTKADEANSKYMERLSGIKLSTAMLSYYDKNQDRFVSDYATLSVDEDMAETFVSFVLEVKPTGKSIKEQKILSFYEDADLVSLRTKLRQNLTSLNLLY